MYKMIFFVSMIFVAESAAYIVGYPHVYSTPAVGYTAVFRRAGDPAPEVPIQRVNVIKSGDSTDPEARLGYVFSRRAEDSAPEVPTKRANVIKSGDSTDPEARLGYVYSSLYSRRAEDSAAQVPVHHADVNSGDSTDPEARLVIVPRAGFSSYSSSKVVH